MTRSRPAAPFRLVSLDHVVLRVRDLSGMTAFYTGALGCELLWQRDELGLVHLRAGPVLLDLLDIAGPLGGGSPLPGGNLDHICLRVSPFDEAAIRAHLADWGAEAGEAMPRFGAEGVGMSFYLTDPECNRVELKAAS